MKIQATLFDKVNTPFRIETIELEQPRTGEVLVKIAAAGICHSDWYVMTGTDPRPTPLVPGHEGAGVVVSVGEGVTQVEPGDHVVLNWAPACGTCFYCLDGRPGLCSTYSGPLRAGTMLDGTSRLSKNDQTIYHASCLSCFAEYAVVHQESCIRISPKLPFAVAAVMGCAVTTGVGAVLNTAHVRPGSTVAVFGAGGIGLSAIMAAQLAGATCIIAIDRIEAKCSLARSFGATEALMAGPDTIQIIRSLTEGRGADYAFEATGLPAVQEQCLDAVRPGGMVVLVGLSQMGSSTNLPGAIIVRQEKTVTGSYYGSCNPLRDLPLYTNLYLKGKLDLDRLISKTYPLEQINQAFAEMLSGQIARAVMVL